MTLTHGSKLQKHLNKTSKVRIPIANDLSLWMNENPGKID